MDGSEALIVENQSMGLCVGRCSGWGKWRRVGTMDAGVSNISVPAIFIFVFLINLFQFLTNTGRRRRGVGARRRWRRQ